MTEISYRSINDPSLWPARADMRRHQISQILHIITPAAAMCIVLSAGPETVFPSTAPAHVWMIWPWNVLLAMAIGVIVWDGRALFLRHRGRRDALRFSVRSGEEAFRFAEEALGVNHGSENSDHRGRTTATGLWETCAVAPLAALAYTAAASEPARPLHWLASTVDQLAADGSERSWQRAAEAISAVSTHLHEAFVSVMNMSQRQRDSVVLVMRDAITPCLAVRR